MDNSEVMAVLEGEDAGGESASASVRASPVPDAAVPKDAAQPAVEACEGGEAEGVGDEQKGEKPSNQDALPIPTISFDRTCVGESRS